MPLHIHALYHVDFEKLGYIEQWAQAHGHSVSITTLYHQDSLPEHDRYDWLIVMGGPMGIHDEAAFPWLIEEKQYIKQAIDAGKTVIGICLGAQLIAHCLGAKVAPSGIKEIGWMPIELTEAGKQHPLLQDLPTQAFNVFHWHGDGFDLPKGAIAIAQSKFWHNQGFIYQNETHQALKTWVMGWQCHFEVMQYSMSDMIKFGSDYLNESRLCHPDSVQSPEDILVQGERYIADNNAWLASMLDRLNVTV